MIEPETLNSLFKISPKNQDKTKVSEPEINTKRLNFNSPLQSCCPGPRINVVNNKIAILNKYYTDCLSMRSLRFESVNLDLGNPSNTHSDKNSHKDSNNIDHNNILNEFYEEDKKEDIDCVFNTSRTNIRRGTLNKIKSGEDATSYYSGYKSTQHSRNSFWPNDSIDMVRTRKKNEKDKVYKENSCGCHLLCFLNVLYI